MSYFVILAALTWINQQHHSKDTRRSEIAPLHKQEGKEFHVKTVGKKIIKNIMKFQQE